MDAPILFDPTQHAHLIPSFVCVHITCITTEPFMIANFLPPLDTARITRWWEERASEVAACRRAIVMQLVRDPETGEQLLAGYVSLAMPESETGPFRGLVEKLLVLPEQRRKGIARRMMLKLDEVARVEGRTLLLLDTERGSPAESIYPKLGYIEIGVVPEYEMSPIDGSLKDGTFFYKKLLPE